MRTMLTLALLTVLALSMSWFAEALPWQCPGTVEVDPSAAFIQVSHSSPWNLEGPPVIGMCPNTAATGGNAQCQVSTKVLYENSAQYIGIRLKDDDIYTVKGLVGGANASVDEGPVVLTFRLLNVGQPNIADEGLPPSGDFTIWESRGAQVQGPRIIPNAMDEFEVTLPQNNDCTNDFADSGTAILILTRINEDTPDPNSEPVFEFVEMELIGAYVDLGSGAPGSPIDVGWSSRMRWIIEDSNP